MQWAKKTKGFTIVELVVVVAVIAVISVVVIVSYSAVTNNAKSLALKNSLKNANGLMEKALAKGQPSTALPSDVEPDNDIVLHLAGSSGSAGDFCINAYRVSTFEVGSIDSKNGEVRDYLCPGILIGSPVGGSLPAIPLSTNLSPDFSEWTLTGSVTYNDSTKELTFSGATGKAESPLVRLAGTATNTSLTYELYSTVSAVSYTPQAGGYVGSAYFASNGTSPVTNTAGYSTNGNAQAVPLNAWTSRTFVTPAGANVQYVRFNINLSSANYTSNNFKVRNPSIERRP